MTLLRRNQTPKLQKGMRLPCIILAKDNWNDFNFYTTYFASIYGANRALLHSGRVKVLQTDAKDTILPIIDQI